MNHRLTFGVLAAMAVYGSASAQTLYSDNFDTDTSGSWQVNTVAGNVATFNFDYSSVGISSAPRSTGGTTRGVKLEANIPGNGVFSGLSIAPLGQSFVGDYILRFDMWQNFNGPFPAGGSGSTQMSMGGIGAPTTQRQFPGGTFTGVGFAASGDGGTATDYRAYNAPGAPFAETSGVYAAGNTAGVTNNTHTYYSGFGNVAAPAAQQALYSQQTGNTAVGTQGMQWHTWTITKIGNTVSWDIDGLRIATIQNATFGGDNIFLGQFDINATSSADPNARALLFGLVDNVEVQAVPEPGTMAALGLGALALIRRRKNRKA
jgi:hypothetical protein